MKFTSLILATSLFASPAFSATFTYDFEAKSIGRQFGGLSDPADTIVDIADGFASITGTIAFSDVVLSDGITTRYGAPTVSVDQFDLSTTTISPIRLNVTDNRIATQNPLGPDDGSVFDSFSLIFQSLRPGNSYSRSDVPGAIDIGDFFFNGLLTTASIYDSDLGRYAAVERVDFLFTSLVLRDADGDGNGDGRPVEPNVVPLPATLPLLLAGLGGAGLVLRRGNTPGASKARR